MSAYHDSDLTSYREGYLEGYGAAMRSVLDFLSRVGPQEIRARFPDFTRDEIIAAIFVLECLRREAAGVMPRGDVTPPRTADDLVTQQDASAAAMRYRMERL